VDNLTIPEEKTGTKRHPDAFPSINSQVKDANELGFSDQHADHPLQFAYSEGPSGKARSKFSSLSKNTQELRTPHGLKD
jgi:hypothetical protein